MEVGHHRREQGGRRVPIIMVTTECQKRGVHEALKDGAGRFVVKPFETATPYKKNEDFITQKLD